MLANPDNLNKIILPQIPKKWEYKAMQANPPDKPVLDNRPVSTGSELHKANSPL